MATKVAINGFGRIGRAVARIITERAGQTEENQITREYIKKLEAAIRKRPDNWLWSHRRWKHSRE